MSPYLSFCCTAHLEAQTWGTFSWRCAGVQRESACKKKGRGESELCYHILFTHSSAFITLPVSSSCWGFARKLCEPAKEVASFNRHLVSLPIAFTKIALMGCLERKSALISLNFLFH